MISLKGFDTICLSSGVGMNLKTQITKIHYDKNSKGLLFELLKVCSLFYSAGSGLKNFLYDMNLLRPKKVSASVISVGNFTTGGVGKTPVVCAIAKYLTEQGERVAIISRGYGGKLNNKNVNVISDGINLYYKADMAGDEPYWLAVNLNMCAVITCSNRYKAARYAVDNLGATKIILDDGFQHRKLYRDIDIVLIDSEKQFGNGKLLPAGPLRESLDGIKRVNKILVVSKNVNHSDAEAFVNDLKAKYPEINNILLCKTEPDYVYNIITGEHLAKGSEVTALSAIGQPEQFYKFLNADYIVKDKITFDDHHQYIKSDIKNIDGNIVTTEKDAVKIALLNRSDVFALKLKTIFDIESLLK